MPPMSSSRQGGKHHLQSGVSTVGVGVGLPVLSLSNFTKSGNHTRVVSVCPPPLPVGLGANVDEVDSCGLWTGGPKHRWLCSPGVAERRKGSGGGCHFPLMKPNKIEENRTKHRCPEKDKEDDKKDSPLGLSLTCLLSLSIPLFC